MYNQVDQLKEAMRAMVPKDDLLASESARALLQKEMSDLRGSLVARQVHAGVVEEREALKAKMTTGIIVTSLLMSVLIFVFLVVDESLVLIVAIGELLVGQPPPGKEVVIPNGVSLFGGSGKSISATQGGMTNPSEDIPRYVKMHKAGLLDIDKIVTHTFLLDEVNDAFELLKSGKAGRIMIKMR